MTSHPHLIVNELQCKANIKKMADKIATTSVFRPHFKTHNSAVIGSWFKEYGISKITVSSLEMAEFFIKNGWEDITIAIPFNPNWLPEINKYGANIKFNLLIEDIDTLQTITNNTLSPIGIFIKIDVGSNRTGIVPENTKTIDYLIDWLSKNSHIEFNGFLAHAGHTYQAKNKNIIENIYFDAFEKMQNLKKRYSNRFKKIILSYGDTPSCSTIENLSHFDEYRPGNFVFYDLMQFEKGICDFNEIAAAVACQVIAKHTERNEIVVHCGAVHLSKDYIEVAGLKSFGEVVLFDSSNSWIRLDGKAYVKSISQEHGVISVTPSIIKSFGIGDTIGIIPVHSCLTAYHLKNSIIFNID